MITPTGIISLSSGDLVSNFNDTGKIPLALQSNTVTGAAPGSEVRGPSEN